MALQAVLRFLAKALGGDANQGLGPSEWFMDVWGLYVDHAGRAKGRVEVLCWTFPLNYIQLVAGPNMCHLDPRRAACSDTYLADMSQSAHDNSLTCSYP